jgi:lipoprotein-anchoring transpeptidase ErfK/SrfK
MAKQITVDLVAQTVVAAEGSTTFHTCECVSGDSSHPTPTGTFKINRKNHPYKSRTYHVSMNYAMFFTNSGEAVHQYHGPAPWSMLKLARRLTNAVGSHGCVRLQEADARKLYKWAEIGTAVIVK